VANHPLQEMKKTTRKTKKRNVRGCWRDKRRVENRNLHWQVQLLPTFPRLPQQSPVTPEARPDRSQRMRRHLKLPVPTFRVVPRRLASWEKLRMPQAAVLQPAVNLSNQLSFSALKRSMHPQGRLFPVAALRHQRGRQRDQDSLRIQVLRLPVWPAVQLRPAIPEAFRYKHKALRHRNLPAARSRLRQMDQWGLRWAIWSSNPSLQRLLVSFPGHDKLHLLPAMDRLSGRHPPSEHHWHGRRRTICLPALRLPRISMYLKATSEAATRIRI
jgi:hypothetical protein